MSTQLVGIARMAAEGAVLEEKRRVAYLEIEARSLIGTCAGRSPMFDWTVNPYRGCEFGCRYCYARYTHEFMELPVEAFETKIYAKRFDKSVFRRELDRVKLGQSIAFGSATDCYQPAERRFGVMRQMLEQVERSARGIRVFLITKSNLIARDATLLASIARHNDVRVNMTITTLDTALARKLEPYAPRPDLRLEAVKILAEAGIETGVAISPVMPRITDSLENLDALAAAAARAGAKYLWAQPLFLKECAQKVFFPWLAQEFPALEAKYRAQFRDAAYLKGPYVEFVKQRADAVRTKYGLGSRGSEYVPAQMSLFTA